MARAFTEIAFTPAVLAKQERYGSARAYAKFMEPEAERADRIGPVEAAFIAQRDGFYQATVSESGWPYVQFRGGPRGFLKILDDKTVAYADFRGNRQYLSTGNLSENDRVSLILMDYPNQRRLKLWGRAQLSEDPALIEPLREADYRAHPERAVVITVEALDWNCPQHITPKFTAEQVDAAVAPLRNRISELEAEVARLSAGAS